MDNNREVEEETEAIPDKDDVKLFKVPPRPSNTAVAKLMRRLKVLVGDDKAKELYSDFTMDIIRANDEFLYGGGNGTRPHVGRLKFPIVCGNRTLIFQRHSGGEVQIMFLDYNEQTNQPFKGVHSLKFEQQFDELWDVLATQYKNYIESLGEPDELD